MAQLRDLVPHDQGDLVLLLDGAPPAPTHEKLKRSDGQTHGLPSHGMRRARSL